VLARAGVERLGYDLSGGSFSFEGALFHAEILPLDEFLPAGGQGVIAMQLRSSDEKTKTIVNAVNDAETLFCLQAEREFLRLLHGDCDTPVGVLATIDNWEITLRAQVFGRSDEPPQTGQVRSSLRTQAPEKISAALHAWMYGQK
jgi:uroporphyrinogen III methyltransferase/synthase